MKGACYSLVEPTPTGTQPQLVAFSPEVAAAIGLNPEEAQRPEFAAVMSGNAPLPNAAGCALYTATPIAHCQKAAPGCPVAPGSSVMLALCSQCNKSAGLQQPAAFLQWSGQQFKPST